MIKETVRVKIEDNVKEKAMATIDKAIDKVINVYNKQLSQQERNKIRNLSLDQLNVSVTSKANLKTLWGLNIESSVPIVVECEQSLPRAVSFLSAPEEEKPYFLMKSNLAWTFSKENAKDGGLTKTEFEVKVIEMLLEDIETAAFYGALSMISERDSNG